MVKCSSFTVTQQAIQLTFTSNILTEVYFTADTQTGRHKKVGDAPLAKMLTGRLLLMLLSVGPFCSSAHGRPDFPRIIAYKIMTFFNSVNTKFFQGQLSRGNSPHLKILFKGNSSFTQLPLC